MPSVYIVVKLAHLGIGVRLLQHDIEAKPKVLPQLRMGYIEVSTRLDIAESCFLGMVCMQDLSL